MDDIHGCNVVSDGRSHSGDPIDLSGHGTHVAGIVAMQGFNGIGGVGVAFNVQIMAIRAAQYSGILTIQDIAEGILYATDQGADVINMSFGGYMYSQVVDDALAVALNQAALVAAAGNDSLAYPIFPGALHYVLAVEAGTPAGIRACLGLRVGSRERALPSSRPPGPWLPQADGLRGRDIRHGRRFKFSSIQSTKHTPRGCLLLLKKKQDVGQGQ